MNGVGPKVALAIVSGYSPGELRRAIVREDAALFETIPGIGRKTAQRVVLELKEKIAPLAAVEESPHLGRRRRPHRRPRRARRARIHGRRGRAAARRDRSRPAAGRARPAGAQGRMSAAERVTAAAVLAPEEDELDGSLRPRRLDEFVGQERVKEQLAISLEAAKARGEALDHVLLAGPPGLGKTSLAYIVREELGVGIRTVAGPALERKGDMAAILTSLEERDVLFVDEIHRLNRAVEEILYPALEDFRLDIIVGQGPAARTLTLDLPPFTLVGATTRTGLLTTPLRDRFGITYRLELYTAEELARIVRRSARILGVEIEDEAAEEIARRARGTPRVANRILRRVRDVAEVRHDGAVTLDGRARGARAPRGRRAGARADRPRAPRRDRAQVRRRARSASRRSPSRSARSRTRSRTSTSRTCSSSASSSGRRAGGSSRARAASAPARSAQRTRPSSRGSTSVPRPSVSARS